MHRARDGAVLDVDTDSLTDPTVPATAPAPRPGSQRGAARLTIGPVGRAARSACTLESQRPRAPPGPDALAGSRNGAGPWRVSMRVALRLLAVLVACLVVASAWGQQSPATQSAASGILETLRPGGHVIVFRHGATYLDQADTDPLNFDNIPAQRQLTDKGRAGAQAVGDVLRAAGVKIGKAYSSRYFRAVETARLIAGKEPQATLDVTEGGLIVSPNEN